MTGVSYLEQVRRLMAGAPGSFGDNLLGMEYDISASLGGSDVLSGAPLDVRRTGDRSCLLVVTARAAETATPDAVAGALERAWMDQLRYRHVEAHQIVFAADAVQLDAITKVSEDGFFVTLRIVVAL
jgi:hypothetical protein